VKQKILKHCTLSLVGRFFQKSQQKHKKIIITIFNFLLKKHFNLTLNKTDYYKLFHISQKNQLLNYESILIT